HYSPFNLISYGTRSHIRVFTQGVFRKGSGTFMNAKSCIFGSVDFNGNAAENHVVRFCFVFLCVLRFKSA
ncbi:unnamed protein product, partial [Staurois parvus]